MKEEKNNCCTKKNDFNFGKSFLLESLITISQGYLCILYAFGEDIIWYVPIFVLSIIII